MKVRPCAWRCIHRLLSAGGLQSRPPNVRTSRSCAGSNKPTVRSKYKRGDDDVQDWWLVHVGITIAF